MMVHHETVGQLQVVRSEEICVTEDLVRRTVGHDAAAVQDYGPPAELVGVGQIMGGHDDGLVEPRQ
jgi:hypothetical protein